MLYLAHHTPIKRYRRIQVRRHVDQGVGSGRVGETRIRMGGGILVGSRPGSPASVTASLSVFEVLEGSDSRSPFQSEMGGPCVSEARSRRAGGGSSKRTNVGQRILASVITNQETKLLTVGEAGRGKKSFGSLNQLNIRRMDGVRKREMRRWTETP